MTTDRKCAWQAHSCEFDQRLTGELEPVPGHPTWYTGRQSQSMARLYFVSPTDDRWWERRPPQGQLGPLLTACLQRAQAEAAACGGVVLSYPFAWDGLELLFVDESSAAAVAAEVFGAGYSAFYTCQGCEVSIKNDEVAIYLDVDEVQVVGS